jgi:hypothetical protein
LTESRAEARLTQSRGAAAEATASWAEAGAETTNTGEAAAEVVEAAAETTEMGESAVQQESERSCLSARPC